MDADEPVWISASWGGGSPDPLDRTEREPAKFFGARCPASSVRLRHYTDFCPGWDGPGLHLWNNCNTENTVAICARKGSLPQPTGGLEPCATDPLKTGFDGLQVITQQPGEALGFCFDTNGTAPSIEAFYCPISTDLVAPPLTGRIGCML